MDLCECQVIIEATCHLDKNGCKLEQKPFINKLMIKDVGLLIGLKKITEKGDVELCHKKQQQQSEN